MWSGGGTRLDTQEGGKREGRERDEDGRGTTDETGGGGGGVSYHGSRTFLPCEGGGRGLVQFGLHGGVLGVRGHRVHAQGLP